MSNQHLSVLIVDDEPRIAGALGRVLKPFYETHLAVSGERALKIIRSRRIHVVLVDQRMPRMTGVELLAKVKLISPNTTRILLTGYADLSVVMDSANQTEIFRYLNKPWRNSELLETVGQACEIAQSLYRRQAIDTQRWPKITPLERTARVKKKVLVLDKGCELLRMISHVLDNRVECFTAEEIHTASKLLVENDINLVMMNISYDDKEAAAFIKTVKALKPDVLCLVTADSANTAHLMSLINEGQIYRFIKKPLKAWQLKMYLISAIRYYNQLTHYPELLARHAVENISNEEEHKPAGAYNRMWSFLLRAFQRSAS